MHHFLLIFDHRSRQLREQRVFGKGESSEAVLAYQVAEQAFKDDQNVEIVLIGADSLETVQRTHGHYFDGGDRVARYLQAV